MESIGVKLTDARTLKGVSAEQAARDTHISRRYIESLEAEDFEQFPAAAYLLGFLRSYSAYLGLDPDELVALYHNTKLQEQPAPIGELLDRRPSSGNVRLVFLILLAIAVVGGVVALFVTGVIVIPDLPRRESSVDSGTAVSFLLEEQFVERRFAQGSSVAVAVDGQQLIFTFLAIEDRVMIQSEAGLVQLSAGEERLLDLTGGGTADIRLAVRQIYLDDDPPAVVARIDRVVSGAAATRAPEATVPETEPFAGGASLEPSRVREASIVTSLSGMAAEFAVAVEAQGLTIVRYQLGSQDPVEEVLQAGGMVSFITDSLARLWVSNAGNVRIQVGDTPLEIGGAGEVAAVALRRAVSSEGTRVEMLPLY